MKSFSIVGPTMWNELMIDEQRECTSVDVFKKRLKTHLFHRHYYQLFIFSLASFPEFLFCYCPDVHFHFKIVFL